VSERLRLFVALDVPDAVRASLASWCERVAPAGVRRVPAENLHVTLAFLGSRSLDDADVVAALLAQLAAEHSLRTVLATVGALWLPPRRPAVLAVAVDASEELAALHAGVVIALAGAVGFEPERRPFRPHVTVGRIARAARVGALAPEPPPVLEFVPPALTLYRSQTTGAGAHYTALARAALTS
jgi:2'-5' RNA ligase